jgi:hypothetical protein
VLLHPRQLPQHKDYDFDHEFKEVMDKYIDYTHRLEIAPPANRMGLNGGHLRINLDHRMCYLDFCMHFHRRYWLEVYCIFRLLNQNPMSQEPGG